MTRVVAAWLLLLTVTAVRADDLKVDELASRCDAYMKARMAYKATKFSGAVLAAKNGQAIYAQGFGFANREYDIPNTPKTRFRLASVSKQFTATGIMILEHEGKLKLDDPISKYVANIPEAWGKATLHHLLSHTSGIPENLRPALLKGMWGQYVARDRLFEHLKNAPLDFQPGEKYAYSNTGYALLGRTIEKITGKTYEEFLRERIFVPLEMHDTGFDSRKLVLKNRAVGYGMEKDEYIHPFFIDLSQVDAAGSMYSTVEDLLKWNNALDTDRILPASSWERMWTPVKNNYGYGWVRLTVFGRTLITHDGGLPGFVTTTWRFPKERVFVAVLANLEGSAVGRIARDLSAILLGEPYDLPVNRTEVTVDPKVFDGLVGEYLLRPAVSAELPWLGEREIRPATILKVTRDGDALYAQATGQGRFRLRPESADAYFAPTEEIQVRFQRDDAGRAVELILHQNGRDVKAPRQPPSPGENKSSKP
ncbi:MAG: beta-lactamase family protein [Gemmataceae bacterium]|nr:beta-lactamase family protein [Gemmataceae bacterium]